MQVTNNLDLNRFELENAKFQVLSSAPSSEEAVFYYDSVIKKFGFYNGTIWYYPNVGLIENVIAGVDAVTISIADKVVTVSVLNATSIDDGLMSLEDYNTLAAATSLATANTLVKRDSNGSASFLHVSVSTPTEDNHAVPKSYVEGLIDKTLKQPEGYNPSTTGSYPTTYNGSAIESGDTFRITAAATIGTRLVNIEDLLIALSNTPGQTDSNWMVAESNRDQATETIKGVARLATTAEITTGTDDKTIVTPKKLKEVTDGLGKSDSYWIEYTQASVMPFVVNHNLASSVVSVSIWADGDLVLADVEKVTDNQCTVTLGKSMALLAISKIQIKVIS